MFVKYLVNGSFPEFFFERYRSHSFPHRTQRVEKIEKFLDSIRSDPAVKEVERTGVRNPELMQRLFDLGIFTLLVPQEYQGEGAALEEYAAVMQKLSELSLSLTVTAVPHSGMGCKAVMFYGSESQKNEVLAQIRPQRSLVAFALTEAEAGSDIANIKTTALRDGDGFKIEGSKTWITNALSSWPLVVLAKTPELSPQPDAITFFLLTGKEDGLVIRQPYPKMALKGSTTSEIFFQDVKVPASSILGVPGKGAAQFNVLVGAGRLGVACGAIGLLRRATKTWLERSDRKSRKKQTELEAQIYQMESVVALCSQPIGLGESEQTVYSGMAKIFCTQKSWEAIAALVDELPELYFDSDFEASLNFCESPVLRVTEGPNEVIAFRCGLDLVFAATGAPEGSTALSELVTDVLKPYARRIDAIVQNWNEQILSDSKTYKPLAMHQGVLENVVDLGIEALKCVSVFWRIFHEMEGQNSLSAAQAAILETTIVEAQRQFQSGGANRFVDELVNVLYA